MQFDELKPYCEDKNTEYSLYGAATAFGVMSAIIACHGHYGIAAGYAIPGAVLVLTGKNFKSLENSMKTPKTKSQLEKPFFYNPNKILDDKFYPLFENLSEAKN